MPNEQEQVTLELTEEERAYTKDFIKHWPSHELARTILTLQARGDRAEYYRNNPEKLCQDPVGCRHVWEPAQWLAAAKDELSGEGKG